MSILTQKEKEICWLFNLKRITEKEEAKIKNAEKFEQTDLIPYPDNLLVQSISWKILKERT